MIPDKHRRFGLQIIESPHMTVPGPMVRRTWRERLFTLPWKPLAATKAGPSIPNPDYFLMGTRIVAHPETARLLREIANRENGDV